MNCPHCGEALPAEVVASAAEESRIIFAVTPAPGELFDIRTIGEILKDVHKMLGAQSKDLGWPKATTLLDRVEKEADGTMKFHLIVARCGSRAQGEQPYGGRNEQ